MKTCADKLLKNSNFICRNYCSVEIFAIELTGYCLNCETLKNFDNKKEIFIPNIYVRYIYKNKISLELLQTVLPD